MALEFEFVMLPTSMLSKLKSRLGVEGRDFLSCGPAKRSRHKGKIVRKTTNPEWSNTKHRCAICNGRFGLIRHRFSIYQFCSKQCLDDYLAKRMPLPSSFKEWMDFYRTQ